MLIGSSAVCVGNRCYKVVFPLFYHGVFEQRSWIHDVASILIDVNQHQWDEKPGQLGAKERASSVLVVRNLFSRSAVGSWFGQVPISLFKAQNNYSSSPYTRMEHVGAADPVGKHEFNSTNYRSLCSPNRCYQDSASSVESQQVWRALKLCRCIFKYFFLVCLPPALI